MKPLPLAGRRIVVTRPRDRAGPLVRALEAAGADVVLCPAVDIAPPEDPEPLRRAAARLDEWDWVVFTSAYAVRALEAARRGLDEARSGESAGSGPRIACVGAATAAAARAAGWAPDVVPGAAEAAADPESARGARAAGDAEGAERTGGAERLARALLQAGVGHGARVLFPRASDARNVLPERLRAAGARVDEVVAYRKLEPGVAWPGLGAELRGGRIDAVTFTAPSTVRNFLRAVGAESLHGVRVVVIGPTTAAAAREAGLRVAGIAAEPSVAGLVDSVVATFNDRG